MLTAKKQENKERVRAGQPARPTSVRTGSCDSSGARASAKGACVPSQGPARRTHLPQLEKQSRVVAASDLVQQVVHQLPAVAPGVLHELLQAGRAGRGRRQPHATGCSLPAPLTGAGGPALRRSGPTGGPCREGHLPDTVRGGVGSLHQILKMAHDAKRLKTSQKKVISEHSEQQCTRIWRTLDRAGRRARAPQLNSAR